MDSVLVKGTVFCLDNHAHLAKIVCNAVAGEN